VKFAYLCSDRDVPLFGSHGCSIHIRDFTDALADAGHEVFVICSELGEPGAATLRARTHLVAPRGLDAQALDVLETEPVIDDSSIERDLRSVLFNSWLQEQGAEILEQERPNLVYERFALFGWGGVALAERFDIPLILEVNAPLWLEQEGYSRFTLPELARTMGRETFRRADVVICVSAWLKEWVVSQGAEKANVHVVPNGFSKRLFSRKPNGKAMRARYDLVGKRVVGYLGSFQPGHDVDGLLEAFADLYRRDDHLRLLLVGDGERREHARAAAAKLGIAEAVVFTGNIAHDSIPDVLGALDVAAVPYRAEDDFYFSPLKLFESMAAGRPTVAAALGQIQEIVEHGETGWLYQAGDTDALAEGIAALLYAPELAAKIGAAARQKALADHTWDATSATILSLLLVGRS
jgi:glycosyltransferase involved in cell wall biosynthesis